MRMGRRRSSLGDGHRSRENLVALWLSLVGIRQSMEPLARLREGTRRLATKDFNARVHISSGDEFEEVAGSFNYMAEQVGAKAGEVG